MKYIDTHSHLYFPQYDEDREEVLARMREAQVATIVVGTRLETSEQALQFATEHPDICLGATIGVHPTESAAGFDALEYLPLLGPRVVAVGECGLDYFRRPREDVYEAQLPVFQKQIEFALEHDLPLMLHIRPSQGTNDAHEDTLALLREYKRKHGEVLRGTSHFFTSSLDIAKQYWELGFTVSIPGVVTFKKEQHLAALVREAPFGMMLSETDAPYAAPEPHRGRRNEPTYVREVVHKIANIRGEDEQEVAAQLRENAARVFKIALA